MSDLVSVIIPTYNRAADCRRAVESVLAQSHREVEVIVVDDGSEDATHEAIEGLDSRVVYLRQENAGVIAARNRGLAAAQGEFIAFLDSDDFFLPWKLEAQLAALRFYSQAGMVWTDMVAVDPEGREIRPAHLTSMYSAYRYFNREERLREGERLGRVWPAAPSALAERRTFMANLGAQMFLGNFVHTSTVLLRRACQRAAGSFDSTLVRSGEDYDFHYRVCQLGPIVYLDVSSILYCVGAADQLTSPQFEIFMARNTLRTISKAYAEAGGKIALPRHVIHQRMSAVYFWVGQAEINQHNRRSARHAFAHSLVWWLFNLRALIFFAVSFLPVSVFKGLRRFWQQVRSKISAFKVVTPQQPQRF